MLSNPEQLAKFQRENWGRKPQLFRHAIDTAALPLSSRQLIDLSCLEQVESRLITSESELIHGPFEDADNSFPALPDASMLMVQCLEQHLEVARKLLDQFFAFIPDWQVDDVMASLGYAGASCGAHFDRYDVFLVQHSGCKVWQLDGGNHQEEDLKPDAEIRLLKDFQPTETWTTEPGDVLYVPPGVGHHGNCEGESITLSVGIRNPTMGELLADLSEFAMLSLQGNPAVTSELFAYQKDIDDPVLDQLENAVASVLDRDVLRRWFGSYSTRLRDPDLPITTLPENGQIKPLCPGASLCATLPTRLAVSANLLFINGEALEFDSGNSAWLTELAENRQVTMPPTVSEADISRLEKLVVTGELYVK